MKFVTAYRMPCTLRIYEACEIRVRATWVTALLVADRQFVGTSDRCLQVKALEVADAARKKEAQKAAERAAQRQQTEAQRAERAKRAQDAKVGYFGSTPACSLVMQITGLQFTGPDSCQ